MSFCIFFYYRIKLIRLTFQHVKELRNFQVRAFLASTRESKHEIQKPGIERRDQGNEPRL